MTENAISLPINFAPFVTDAFVDPFMGVRHMELHFPNGFGASIIHGHGTYGLELAVLHGDHICAGTPIAPGDGILAWLSMEGVLVALTQIMALEAAVAAVVEVPRD